ncbi:MAG TPA: hypothetical protein VK518_17565 [Puia sp.]|nr:hypothetical protein [Puia sp.]
MDINQEIRSYSAQPLTHQLLLSLLKRYKRPNDKVHALVQKGVLESIKKGLYIAGPALNTGKPEPLLLANHVFGPSYVSSDAALYYYGMIPERVYEMTSMTTKASREFSTPVGLFSYTRLPLPYYSFGIKSVLLSDQQFIMMASPEKALFDKVVSTSGLVFRSKKAAMEYLLENLRINEDSLKVFDTKAMSEWLPDAPKKNSLLRIINMINDL